LKDLKIILKLNPVLGLLLLFPLQKISTLVPLISLWLR